MDQWFKVGTLSPPDSTGSLRLFAVSASLRLSVSIRGWIVITDFVRSDSGPGSYTGGLADFVRRAVVGPAVPGGEAFVRLGFVASAVSATAIASAVAPMVVAMSPAVVAGESFVGASVVAAVERSVVVAPVASSMVFVFAAGRMMVDWFASTVARSLVDPRSFPWAWGMRTFVRRTSDG